MERFIDEVTLVGQSTLLEPLRLEHEPALREAAADGELWRLWYCSVPKPDHTRAYIEAAIDGRNQFGDMPFVVREMRQGKPGAIVGCTRFFKVDAVNRRLEIGYTWYARRVQRTAINTAAKHLLLSHAFEKLNCIAVEFRTHWMNHRSREAIARLGAKQDGVLRNHVIMHSTYRDTVVFSIIESEWPTVKLHLRHLMDLPR